MYLLSGLLVGLGFDSCGRLRDLFRPYVPGWKIIVDIGDPITGALSGSSEAPLCDDIVPFLEKSKKNLIRIECFNFRKTAGSREIASIQIFRIKILAKS